MNDQLPDEPDRRDGPRDQLPDRYRPDPEETADESVLYESVRFTSNGDGYQYATDRRPCAGPTPCYLHRLAFVAWHGLDQLDPSDDIHHVRPVPWLNTESNLRAVAWHEHRARAVTEERDPDMTRDPEETEDTSEETRAATDGGDEHVSATEAFTRASELAGAERLRSGFRGRLRRDLKRVTALDTCPVGELETLAEGYRAEADQLWPDDPEAREEAHEHVSEELRHAVEEVSR